MQLQAIFAGKIQEVTNQGKKVRTGIFKNNVTGPVRVYKLNIEGDEQADLTVHGGVDKAVYAYPSEHYEFWKRERADLQFKPGLFGENLSTTGLDETTVCIGDVFRIGSVKLSVTSPRMPCFKLGIRMNDPHFVKDFTQAERNGFYFKVVEEGYIEAGNHIEKIDEDRHGLTVKEVMQLYTTRKEDQELLKKAVSSPGLPKDWRDHFEVRLLGK